jgi:hypothetical protein
VLPIGTAVDKSTNRPAANRSTTSSATDGMTLSVGEPHEDRHMTRGHTRERCTYLFEIKDNCKPYVSSYVADGQFRARDADYYDTYLASRKRLPMPRAAYAPTVRSRIHTEFDNGYNKATQNRPRIEKPAA